MGWLSVDLRLRGEPYVENNSKNLLSHPEED